MQKVRLALRRQAELLSGNHDDRHFRLRLMNELHGLEAVHPWHENVDDEQVKGPGPKQFQAGPAVVDSLDRMRILIVARTARSSSMTRMLAMGFPESFVRQLKVTYFPMSAKVEARIGWR
jgi:hypothetical protein